MISPGGQALIVLRGGLMNLAVSFLFLFVLSSFCLAAERIEMLIGCGFDGLNSLGM
jgi:hypothetical protein